MSRQMPDKQFNVLLDLVHKRHGKTIDTVRDASREVINCMIDVAADDVLKSPPRGFHDEFGGEFSGMGNGSTNLYKAMKHRLISEYFDTHFGGQQ